jgi:ferredoxin
LSSGWINSFLKRFLGDRENPFTNQFSENRLRPPGAVEEKRFMALCIRCNRCLEVCPYGSIRRAGFGATIGTPYVFPLEKACYLCMACCRLCPTGALDKSLSNPEGVAMGKPVLTHPFATATSFSTMMCCLKMRVKRLVPFATRATTFVPFPIKPSR